MLVLRVFEHRATEDEKWALWFLMLKSKQSVDFDVREKFLSRFNHLAERVFARTFDETYKNPTSTKPYMSSASKSSNVPSGTRINSSSWQDM
jgi:hypothetical protein